MSEIEVDVSDLKSAKGEHVDDLCEFLEKRLGVTTKTSGDKIILDFKEEEFMVNKDYLRIVLKRFLHKAELKEDFRIISGGENALIIKKKRKREEI